MIPPKMFTRIPSTFGSSSIIPKAVVIDSLLAPPPMSRKFAGSPPYSLITSIEAMANPAPLTRQPIFPSNLTYDRPDLLALISTSSSSDMSLISALQGCLNEALSSKLILESSAIIAPSPALTRGLISTIEQSRDTNMETRRPSISLNESFDTPVSPRESAIALSAPVGSFPDESVQAL